MVKQSHWSATMARLRRSLDEGNHTSSVSDEMLDGAQNLTQVAQDDEQCAMDCRNGGECRLGRAVHGFSADLLEDEDHLHYGDQITKMHCVCPQGWTGLYCELKLAECKGETCFNGKQCLKSEDDYGMLFHHCECNGKKSDFSLPYASHFCGEEMSIVCTAQRFKNTHSYCKNGGRCLDLVTDPSQPNVGCECTPGWEGPHCAHVEGTFYKKEPLPMDQIVYSLLVIILGLITIGVIIFKLRRQSPKQEARCVPV